MIASISNGIKIEINTQYVLAMSKPEQGSFMFSYHISITNTSDYTVQLTKRFWRIFDSDYSLKYTEGVGVVGEQPILAPNQKFEYNSGCSLNSDMGYMQGYYTFVNTITNEEFKVQIPRFELIVPEKLN
ncbi:MAG: Co2+/Mg2+ efflux protein ApaG [Bacteroidia bacterium]|nr:Co2+/Mg2+ efflux protein ApaG [Bacteroidia bacterium]